MSLFEFKGTLLIAVTTLTVAAWYYWNLSRKGFIDQKRAPFLLGVAVVSLAAAVWGDISLIRQLRDVPTVLFSTPGNNTTILSHKPDIDVTLSAPIEYATLAIHTNPPIEFTVKRHGYLFNLIPLGTKLTIIPKTTLPPGEKIMVYLANIEGPITKGYGGEQLLEMTVEDQRVIETNPPDNSEHLPVIQEFTVTISSPILSKDEWSVKSNPAHPFVVTQAGDKALKITPEEPMRQGETYRVALIQTPVIISRAEKSIFRQMDPVKRAELRFSVVKPAFVSSFTPNGDTVNPNDPIVLVFDQPMNKQSVTEFLRLTPESDLKERWDDGANTLTLSHTGLQKDTEYTLTLAKGLETVRGGTLDADAEFRFKTAGPVKLIDVSPADGDRNAQTTGPITLIFDQPVTELIKSHITISPQLEGSYTVRDNMVEFAPVEDLPFDTKYTIGVTSGAPGLYGLPSNTEKTISFTTKPDQISLDVPYFRQQTNFTCNIAAARMLLAYRGISVTEQDLIDKIGIGGKRGSGNPHIGYIDDFGTLWEAVLKGVVQYRNARIINSGNLRDLLEEVKNGNPVMTWGQNGWSDPHDISWRATDGAFIRAVNGMHSMVVRGYIGSSENPSRILVSDPWRGQYELNTSEFLRRWSYYKIAMVIE